MIIYKTTNLINGKWYIGKDAQNKKTYLGSGTLLKRAIEKYGKNNFTKEILQHCENQQELRKAEREWIEKTNAVLDNNSYNLVEGGFGSSLSGKNHYNYGKPLLCNELNKRKVVCLNNNTVYGSIADAARATGAHGSAISLICQLKTKSSKGFIFRYLGEESLRFITKKVGRKNKTFSAFDARDGKKIWSGDSTKRCSENLGIDRSTINDSLSHRSIATKYIFRYDDDKTPVFVMTKKSHKRVKNVETQEVFLSIREATRKYSKAKGTSTITTALRKKHRGFGYHWEYYNG